MKTLYGAYQDQGLTTQGLYVCSQCGHGFVSSCLSDDVIMAAEASEKGAKVSPTWSVPTTRVTFENLWTRAIRVPALQDIVDRYASKTGPLRVLDIGARGGKISFQISWPESSDIDLMQGDTSGAYTDNAESVRQFNGLLADLEADYRADVVIALHVLEHVDDPVAFLADVGTRLKNENAFAIFEVPFEFRDARAVATGEVTSLNHKSYFSPWSFRAACQQAGLHVAEIEVESHDHTGKPERNP